MRRRHFLRLTGLGAACGLALPLLPGCKEKHGGKAAQGRPRLPDTELADHVAAADAVGKPTLVLVVPDDDNAKHERGSYFGATLQTANAVLMRELATVHVVCATSAQVGEIAPLPEVANPGPAYLVERGKSAWIARNVPGAVPDRPDALRGKGHGAGEDAMKAAQAAYLAWVAPFRDALVQTIAGDAERVKRRAARVLSLLDEDDRAHVTAAIADRRRSANDLIALAPAAFRADDYFSHDDEDNWTEALAGVARKQLVEARIPGARWATNEGCGHRIDDVPRGLQPACGMGFVPKAGRRFLWLFADPE